MEETPSRRRETFTSLQLQRAADQLQDAIQSVRQRRSMYSSHCTSLSLLSDSSDEEEDLDYDNSDNQENRPQNGSTVSLSRDDSPLQTHSPRHKVRRFMLDAPASGGHRSGASLSLKDLHASPLRPPRDPHTTQHHKQRVYVDTDKPTDEGSTNDGQSTSELRDRRGSVAEKAMAALQHELEDQARANPAMQKQLLQVADTMRGFVALTVGESTLGISTDTTAGGGEVLNKERVKTMSDGWIQALERWRCARETECKELTVRLQKQEEESQNKIHALETVLKSERESMGADLESKQSIICVLQERVDLLMSTAAISQEAKISSDRAAMLQIEQAQMEIEDLRARLVANSQREKQATVKPGEARCASAGQQQQQQQQQPRQVLDLLAQLKQSELRELQWEMLFDAQSQETAQTKERLAMLLEDVAGRSADDQSRRSSPVVIPSTTAPASSPHLHQQLHSPRTHRASFASSTTSGELQLCQQRIEFLEDQLRDVKEQINCDHHQFLYEQQKWELEKKHMGLEVEEVHGVSVKVLKLLLIREKLLKRHELKLQKRVDKLTRGEQSLRKHHELVLNSVDLAMQECAVALLYVRQLALVAPSTTRGAVASDRPPVKPISFVRLLKRLKNVQHELMSGDGNGIGSSDVKSTS